MSLSLGAAVTWGTVTIILGGALITGVRSRVGVWHRRDWIRWLSRLLVIAGALALGILLAVSVPALLPNHPAIALFIQISSISLAGVYAIAELVEFAFAPKFDETATPRERSPFFVSSFFWVFALFVLALAGLFAVKRAYPGFPLYRVFWILLGSVLFIFGGVFPPRWQRDFYEWGGGLLGPVGGRVYASLFGLALVGLGALASDAFLDSIFKHR